MNCCRDCDKPLSGEKVIHGEKVGVYVQPGGCVEISITSDEGYDMQHFCDWPAVVAFVAEEVQRRKCCIYNTDINPEYES